MVRTATEKLSKTGAMRGRIVPPGTVLVTCIAGSLDRIGDAAITDRGVAINQQINAIIPSANVESLFLWQLVKSLKMVIQNHAARVMTRIINKSALEKIPAIYPPLPLQQEFAAYTAEIHALETAQAASRWHLDELSHSLLHQAFEGKL